MVVVLGNLPNNTRKKDIRALVGHHKKCKVKFLKQTENPHSNYECMVKIDVKDPIAGSILVSQLNHLHWRGTNITAHRLLF